MAKIYNSGLICGLFVTDREYFRQTFKRCTQKVNQILGEFQAKRKKYILLVFIYFYCFGGGSADSGRKQVVPSCYWDKNSQLDANTSSCHSTTKHAVTELSQEWKPQSSSSLKQSFNPSRSETDWKSCNIWISWMRSSYNKFNAEKRWPHRLQVKLLRQWNGTCSEIRVLRWFFYFYWFCFTRPRLGIAARPCCQNRVVFSFLSTLLKFKLSRTQP